jgi:undecaprenyl-diphosphatase
MSLFEAVVLGLVQGLTEFLPISSTAHLRIVPELFGWPDPGAAYSAIIQLGTSAAVILYFWRDLGRLVSAFFRGVARRAPFETLDSRQAWFVLVGTIPIGLAGLLFRKTVENEMRSLYGVAGALIVLAIMLWVAERAASHQRTVADMTLGDSFSIGMWQALALVPGASRSGTTLTGALFRGFGREDAARFSFLLSIPATTLAGVFQLRELLRAADRPSTAALVLGTAVAFGSGLVAIAALLRYLRTRTTFVFVAYRVGLGALLLVLLSIGVIHPYSGLKPKHGDPPRRAPPVEQVEH